jgi:phosphoenolpyruvate carboxylase
MDRADPHQPLRDNVRLLGEILGRVLKDHGGQALFERVEQVRALAKAAADRDGAREFNAMAGLLREMPIEEAEPVARAFAQFLNLANIAEQHHRVRRRRDYARDPGGRPQRGSCAETFARLRDGGLPAETLARQVRALRIELVLTAHPTEILRRTLIQKHNRMAATLAFRDRPDLTPVERKESFDALHREIAAAWQTDEVRRDRVPPLDEVRAGLVIFEQSLWEALPRFVRAVDDALATTTGEHLPLDLTLVRFGSWIGGDRDGNPGITPEVTRQATWLARWQAADLYLRDIIALRDELSLTTGSDELRRRSGSAREPYRAVLKEVRDRLLATRDWAQTSLADAEPPAAANQPYLDAADFAAPLNLCARSLDATGNGAIAAGRLADVLRRLAVFGLTLTRLDVRQDAHRHADAIEWIAQTCALGGYAGTSEPERQTFLLRELHASRVKLDDLPLAKANDEVRDVIETFRMAARLHPESLGAYVITMAAVPSDVLAVEFLQAAAGNRHPQRVVPLFETADDLKRAAAVMTDLFALPWYRARIDGRQEVMIGYSDSAKDAGRFAAAWLLYRAQQDIVAACERDGVQVTLFHGRGGSIGRGGGPTYLAIQSQPPGSVGGALRVTEQGEMIQAKFGLVDIALRTLEVYTTATLEATVAPQAPPRAEWTALMEELAAKGRAAYRAVVYDDPRFNSYFRTATPQPELGMIHIGSRPSRRGPDVSGGVESLRAISWQFAWTQNRLLLATWLGLDEPLSDAVARGRRDTLREMYAQWPFFRSFIDLIEMAVAKADGRIAAQYDQLVAPELRPLGEQLRQQLARTIDLVLTITGHKELLETNAVLRRSIDVRNPYVDPINLVQVELLRRLRGREVDERLRAAFGVTVNGIAAGMRNTG